MYAMRKFNQWEKLPICSFFAQGLDIGIGRSEPVFYRKILPLEAMS
jgi:hypothetical protein